MDPDDRPIKGGPAGNYNLQFIDWQNEWERLAEEGMPSWYEDSAEENPEEGSHFIISFKNLSRGYGI
jgi:hypothetical protein